MSSKIHILDIYRRDRGTTDFWFIIEEQRKKRYETIQTLTLLQFLTIGNNN